MQAACRVQRNEVPRLPGSLRKVREAHPAQYGYPSCMAETTAPREPARPGGTDIHETMDDPQSPAGDRDTGRKVIVGIDGSVESRAALVWALRHTAHTGGDVHAVAVAPTDPVRRRRAARSAGMGVRGRSPSVALRGAARPPGRPRPRAHPHRTGRPCRRAVEHALDAELLILGNHGRGALRGALLCSVGLRCVNHAPLPGRRRGPGHRRPGPPVRVSSPGGRADRREAMAQVLYILAVPGRSHHYRHLVGQSI